MRDKSALMKNTVKKLLAVLIITAVMLSCNDGGNNGTISDEEIVRITQEAYIYALPLVIMDLTKTVSTNMVPNTDGHAPINQFSHRRTTATAADRDVVRLNVDTLYSFGWLDLSGGPIVFSKPDTGDIYFTVAVLDAYTNCYHTLGTGGIGGNGAAVYTIHGPNHTAAGAPAGSIVVSLPTNMVWMMGRLEVADNDNATLHTIQNSFSLVPLSEYGNPGYVQPRGEFNRENLFEPFERVQAMDIETFFNMFNELAVANPGTSADRPALQRFAGIGVGPGLVFSLDSFPSDIRQTLRNIGAAVIYNLTNLPDTATPVNGWIFAPNHIAQFGTYYPFRAHVALTGLGANPVSMAVYPFTSVDSNGQPLNGNNNYVIRFEADKFPPPNDAFWSITAYDADWFLIPNAHNKYAIRGRDNIVRNPDGSVDIYLQHDSPGSGLLANWLPVPRGIFQLTMRIYRPRQSVLNGTWEPPPVSRVN